mmetsp:Transcript_9980/g.14104  ORF Transcript_9980/g.14104 Transcript_9980/m.14104 type:complete len:571 (-) Transcript_9980:118-1830(-)
MTVPTMNAICGGSGDKTPIRRNIEAPPRISRLSDESISTLDSKDDSEEVLHSRESWVPRMLQWLRNEKKYLDEPGENDSRIDQYSRNYRRRRLIVIGTIMTTLLAFWWRRSKRKMFWFKVYKTLFPFLVPAAQLSQQKPTQQKSTSDYRRAKEAPLSLVLKAAKEGSIQKALFTASQSAISYKINGEWMRSSLPTNNPSVQENLLETLASKGCTDVSILPESLLSRLSTPAIATLPFVYLALLWRMMRNIQGKDDSAKTYDDKEASPVTFDDVAGIDEAVDEVGEIVSYLTNPTLYNGLGARPPRGILLYGPPGSGKTLLAQAVAGEANCEAFVACSGSDFVDTYVGRGAARIRTLFEKARLQASRRDSNYYSSWLTKFFREEQLKSINRFPAVIVFMDEIDALAKSRSGPGGLHSNDERDQTLNQLLTELDGFASNQNLTVIFIGATNRPDVLDPAIIRRFDRQIHVGYPNRTGRREILQIHTRRIQHGALDLDQLAHGDLTGGFSGADLRNVVNDAALLAVRDKSSLVEQRHLLHATRRMKNMKTSLDPVSTIFPETNNSRSNRSLWK